MGRALLNAGVSRRRVGGLDCLDFPVENAPDAATFVVFHGYGADAMDLAPLAMELPLARRLRWVFPDAPLALSIEGYASGRAWFPIEVEALDRAQREGKPWDISARVPEGMAEARELAFDFLKKLGVDWSRLVLGGFSQGAMLATDLSLRAPASPLGLVILSGNLVSEKEWRELAPKRAGLPFFQSHGSADPILSYRGARSLESLLQEAGLKGVMLRFENGHSITPEVIQGLARFLDGLRAP